MSDTDSEQMATDPRIVTRLRNGTWMERTVGGFQIVALVALALDTVTTLHILTSDGYAEANVVIDAMWAVGPTVGTLYVVGYFGAFGLLCTRQLGWFSTAVAVHVTIAMGVFGGLNNLALFVMGPPALIDFVAAGVDVSLEAAVTRVIPSVAAGTAIVVARLVHGRLPWREVLVVAAGAAIVGFVGEWLLLNGTELVIG